MKTLNTKSLKMNFRSAARHLFPTVRGESGAALIMAMLFMIVIVLLVAGVTSMTVSDFGRVANYTDSRRAFYITEAGIETGKFYLRSQDFDDFLTGPDGLKNEANLSHSDNDDNGLIHDGSSDPGGVLQGTEVTIDGNKYSQFNFDNGTYNVRVFDNQDETTNAPYTDTDNMLVIESIGITEDGTQKRIIAAYRKYDLEQDFPAAVTMVGPVASITAGGNIEIDAGDANYAWDLNGYAVHTGSPASRNPNQDTDCPSQNAISTQDTGWTYQPSDWAGGSENGFNGKDNTAAVNNGLPDVGVAQTTFSDEDSETMRLELMGYCDTCYTGRFADGAGGTVEVFTGETFGTLADPEITYIDGNAKMAGGTKGAGVLIVDGNFDVNGQFDWAGVIIIGGCATCWGELQGTGDAKIYGALVVGNAIDGAGSFTGSALIYYSCDAVDIAHDVFNNTFKKVGWHESD